MSKIKTYEMFEVMPIYWTDGLTAILINPAEQSVSENQKAGPRVDDDTVLPKRVLVEVIRVIRDTVEARDLKNLYKNRCQICRIALPLIDRFYSEAHHLQPLGSEHKGHDIRANMLIVCPNHHALLDSGAIAIEPTTNKVINYQGDEIGYLFEEVGHGLGKNYLKYHFEKRFKKKSI